MAVHKCSIIANPEGAGWDFAEQICSELKKRNSDFELNKVDVQIFRDGEIKPKIYFNVRKRNCYFIHDPNLSPADWFLHLCLINQTLKKSGAQEIINVFPYLKFSRQDRKDESRVPISAKVVADVVELYANRVLTLDYHNPSIDGFYKIPVDDLSSYPVVVRHITKNHPEILENVLVMSTDAGGAPRAKEFAKQLGISSIAVGYKVREKAGEVESLQILGDVKDKNVLIVDDIVDSGNTLVKAADSARKGGASKVYGYCTHGLFTEGIGKVASKFDKFFIGDTVKLKEEIPENVEIISFVQLFADAIFMTSEGKSLSELYSR